MSESSILFRDRMTPVVEIRRLAREEFDSSAISELALRGLPLLFVSQEEADQWLTEMQIRLPTVPTRWMPRLVHAPEPETELQRRRREAEGLPVRRVTQPTRASRRRDQPLPTVTEGGICVQDEVMAYIERRKAIGIERYGTVLQPHNGRDALRDAFEEAVDLTQYLAQALIERDGHLPGAES